MKTFSSQLLALFLITLIGLSSACEITVGDGEDTFIELDKVETFGWVYSDIIFEGNNFPADCGDIKVSLNDGTTTRDLDINSCSATEVVAWIPEDMPAGTYEITFQAGNATFTSVDLAELQVEIKIRPVILTLSATEVPVGGTIELTGLNIINDTNNSVYDPTVWITASGYTNTVSDITVNDEGTAATVVLDDDIAPGDYDFKLTCVEWSNELQIKIKQ